jgi:hypothetical protein
LFLIVLIACVVYAERPEFRLSAIYHILSS